MFFCGSAFSIVKKIVTQDFFFFLKLGFTLCKAEQPLQGTQLQEKETQED